MHHPTVSRRGSRPTLAALTLAVLLTVAACGSGDETAIAQSGEPPELTTAPEPGCDEPVDHDPAIDHFPDKATVDHAERLSISYERNYKVARVSDANFGGESFTYVLVQCGTPAPELTGDLADAVVIDIPVNDVVVMSTTVLPGLDAIDRLDVLLGLDSFDFIHNENVLALVDAGELAATGNTSFELDLEALVEVDPELVITNAFGAAADEITPVSDLGIPVAVSADYRETSPLGRAEWMKFTALFLNEEAAMNEVFAEVEAGYLEGRALVADVADDERPTVLTNAFSEFDGAWLVPGGDSYVANFVRDAGGRYLFADEPGNASVPLDLETVLERAAEADVWLNPGFGITSLDDLEVVDPRHTEFAPYATGEVWNNDLLTNAAGGNDYFERGAARPDLVLADLISILHPDRLAGHELVFYRRLT